jgi:hypothetical protein
MHVPTFHPQSVSTPLGALALIAALFLPSVARPHAGAQTAKLAGDWKGTSLCTIKSSPCHDENVIYHVTEPNPAGDLTIQMDKIVEGKPEFMVTLDCKFDSRASTVTCPMKNGEWRFTVAANKMTGTLKLPDGTLYRNISVQRSK